MNLSNHTTDDLDEEPPLGSIERIFLDARADRLDPLPTYLAPAPLERWLDLVGAWVENHPALRLERSRGQAESLRLEGPDGLTLLWDPHLNVLANSEEGLARAREANDQSPFNKDPSSASPHPGADRLGPYVLIEVLGKGGQGVVWKAQHARLAKTVAVKLLLHATGFSEDLIDRFRREAHIGAAISHPVICAVLDVGESKRIPYIVMEYVEGETLAKHIDKLQNAAQRGQKLDGDFRELINPPTAQDQNTSTHPLDEEELRAGRSGLARPASDAASSVDAEVIRWTLEYFEKVARALHFAHEKGVVHRDLKPGNLMITLAGEPKIMDFGLARMEESGAASLTHTGDLLGTPAYMSPEQLSAHRMRVDERTDIWSLGVTLYECLALCLPFVGPSREALYQAINFRDPQPLRRLNSAVGKDLRVVVEKCLEKDRDRRYESALQLAEELARVLKKEPIVARPVGPLLRTARWAERHPALAIVLALLFVSICSFGSWQWMTNRDLQLSQAAAEANARRADANASAAEANAREARRNEERAERVLGEYSRLADIRRLQNARNELAALWPIDPKIVEPLRAWQRRYEGEGLFGNLSGHRAALEDLRKRAQPYTEADRQRDFATELAALAKAESERAEREAAAANAKAVLSAADAQARQAAQAAAEAAKETQALEALASLTEEQEQQLQTARRAQSTAEEASRRAKTVLQESTATNEAAAAAMRKLEDHIAQLRLTIAGRGNYSFEDIDLQFRHDNLALLVMELTAFVEAENTSAIRNAAARLQRSEQIEGLTVTGPEVAPAWAACIQRAYDNDRYVLSEEDYEILDHAGVLNGLYEPTTRRLRLKPQLGLIPLGPDPTSGLEEFLHLPSHDYAWDGSAVRLPVRRKLPAGDRRSAFDLSNDDGQAGPIGQDGIILVLVPGGSFLVGEQKTKPEGPNYDPAAIAEEASVQRATLLPWLLAKYELTQGQWERGAAFFGDFELRPSQYGLGYFANQRNILPRAVGRDHPVEQIDHTMATRWLAHMGLELPTEVQWERAARGGALGERWAGASTIEDLKRIANISGAETAQPIPSWLRTPEHRDAYVLHAPVGRFEGNGYGLFDLTGNILEWTRDGHENPPAAGRAGDGLRFLPVGADAAAARRVSRGGSFSLVASDARVSLRNSFAPSIRVGGLGARPSRGITP